MEEMSSGLKVLRSLKQVMKTIKKNMKQQFRKMQLTAPQGMLMGILAHFGEMKVSDLSEKLGLSNSTVSGIVDRLEKQGFVERKRSEEDRRIVYVNVTSKFRKDSKEHFGEIEKMFEDMMKKATPEELETILKGLEALEQLMNRQNI